MPSFADFMLSDVHYERAVAAARERQEAKLRHIDMLRESVAHAERYGAHPLYKRDLAERLSARLKEL